MIPQTTLDEILDRTDIVEIISSYIPLKRAGRNFKARCPFHNEKTPSFVVSPDKQIYHCFGCGMGGNAFNFLMKYERLEFTEAAELLAQKAGVEIPRKSTSFDSSQSEVTNIYSANQTASGFYHYGLLKMEYGKKALQYLKQRGVKEETVAELKIGYAPNSWDAFLSHATKNGTKRNALEKAGLILPGRDGTHYDRFRNRIVFPIFNAKGSVIGFGARVLDKSLPKYVNSPETKVFSKGRHLYGLNFAKDHIKQKDLVIIVEGYLDFLALYQSDIKNVVASLGTALTIEHVRLLKRYSKNIAMVFDADQAGERATLRGLDIALTEGLSVKVVSLPKGHDPDTFVKEKGPEQFLQVVDRAKTLFDYKFDLLISRFDLNTPEGKTKVTAEMLPTIAKVPNAILKSEYIKRLAENLKLNETALWTELKKVKPDYSYTGLESSFESKQANLDVAKQMIIGLLLEDNRLIAYAKSELKISEIEDEDFKVLLEAIFTLSKKTDSISPGKLIANLEDESLCQIVPEICTKMVGASDRKKTLDDCIKAIEKTNMNRKLRELQKEISLAQNTKDEKTISVLVNKYSILVKKFQGRKT